MVLNNGIAPCGTMSRCCCCNMRLICAKSPYCVINSGSGSSDKKLEEIENLIQQLIQSQTQAIADFETKAAATQASLNTITANMGYAVQMKAQHPELTFTDDYQFEKLSKITGELVILGLSPWNDFHIFETIDKSEIDACTFYYFSE